MAYEFASGVINVLEKKVFDKLDQERMLASPDKESAFSVLFDTDMGEIASKEKDAEKILEGDIERLKKIFEKALGEKENLLSVLFLKFDALNIKLALKKILSKNPDLAVLPFSWGLTSYEKIEQKVTFFLSEKLGSKEKSGSGHIEINFFVNRMLESVFEAIKMLSLKSIDSKKIESLVDKAYFETKLKIAKAMSDDFLLEISRIEIDISNIKGLLKAEKDVFDFIEGGSLKKEEVAKLIALKEGEIFQDLKKFLEVFNLSLLMERFAAFPSLSSLENKLQGFLSERIFLKEKETGEGLEKILAFFQKKINSHSNIRMILFAKENNLPLGAIESNLLPI